MSDEGQRANLARKNEGQSLARPSISTPEAADLMNKNPEGETRPAAVTLAPGDKIPSFSPSAKSASKRSKRTVAHGGDTLMPGDKISSQERASVPNAPAVTADLTEGPEGGTKPDGPEEDPMPLWLRRWIDQGLPRVAETCVPPQQAGFVPSILRRPENADLLRTAEAVTFPVTPSQAPPASVTPTVTAAPVAGSVCPTCRCRVPARLTPAERQRAYRRRKREQGQGVAKGD